MARSHLTLLCIRFASNVKRIFAPPVFNTEEVFQPSFVAPEDALSLVYGVKPRYSATVYTSHTSQLFGGISRMAVNLEYCILGDFCCQTCLVAE